ncbi:MAG TPA: VOC family protein [Kiloniellaceae bacterium]|nr:VOC family protein [Kiloniellaceae bacterium]
MGPAPAKQQITFIYCHDLDGSARFYGDTLGLSLALDQGACRIFQVAEGAFLGVCSCREDRAVAPAGVVLSLVTEDVDGWHERLSAAGVPIEAPPAYSEAFRVYSFFARDPAGYRVEFQRFDRPDWVESEAMT